MNKHHQAMFLIATMGIVGTTAPWVGPLLAAVASGGFAIISVLINGVIQTRRQPKLESAVVAAMAKANVALQEELDRVRADNDRLRADQAARDTAE